MPLLSIHEQRLNNLTNIYSDELLDHMISYADERHPLFELALARFFWLMLLEDNNDIDARNGMIANLEIAERRLNNAQ